MTEDRLILASTSPRRLQLLKQIGVEPTSVLGADIDETPLKTEKPYEFAKRMAFAKATKISNSNKDKYILAADTVVAIGRLILPKAKMEEEVRRSLTLLGGRNHRVYGGICLIQPGGKAFQRLVETRVFMRRLSSDEVSNYVSSGEWEGKAGSYAIQGKGAQYIKKIYGSYTNVVGLDLYTTSKLLKGCGLIFR